MNNFWNNIARSTVRELARAAGLRVSNEHAVADLTATYGPLPTAEFVDEMWFVLRDGWLTRSAPHREAVVAKMLALGRGSATAKTKTRAGQLAYLRSLRRSPALADAVLEVFLESGATERPEPIFIDAPVDPQDQQARFFASIREGLLRLNTATIEGYERAVHATVHNFVSGLTLPIVDPGNHTTRLTGAVVSVFLLDDLDEPPGEVVFDYQRTILERLPGRIPDVAAVQRLLGLYVGHLESEFTDKDATAASIATWASSVFMASLAFDGGQDAPDGFVLEIGRAQQRFFGDSEPEQAEALNEEGLGFDEVLIEIMSRVPNGTRSALLDSGALVWNVFMGSAVVSVVRSPLADNAPPLIRLASPLVSGVASTSDLLTTLNLLNAQERLLKFHWDSDTVWQEHEFFVDPLNDRLFLFTLRQFANAADHFDTMFRERFGGTTVGQDQKAVFDA